MVTLDRHRPKRRFRQLLLLCASAILTLIVLELIFRAGGIHGSYHQPRIDRSMPIAGKRAVRSTFGYFSNSIIVSQYDSDPRGYFDPGYVISHSHNSVGWRDSEHTLEKPTDVYRILGVGDSYLYGQGVRHEDVCLTKLTGLLKETLEPKTIETINTGASGSNTVRQFQMLSTIGLAYDPDLVIVHFVLNDISPVGQVPQVKFYKDYTNIYQTSDWFCEYSYLWSWCRQRFLKTVRAKRHIRDSVDGFRTDSDGWRLCRDALSRIKQICDANDTRTLVVIFPYFIDLDGDYPFQPIHTIVADYCRSQGINVLDLRDQYRSHHGPELWVHPTDQHPNETAHDIAARAIARYLKDHAEALLWRAPS